LSDKFIQTIQDHFSFVLIVVLIVELYFIKIDIILEFCLINPVFYHVFFTMYFRAPGNSANYSDFPDRMFADDVIEAIPEEPEPPVVKERNGGVQSGAKNSG